VPKVTGIISNLWVDQYNVSGDIGAVDSIAMSRVLLDYTGIDKEFMERLPGLGDGSISFSGFFNSSAGQFHAVYGSAFSTALSQVTVSIGTAIGDPAASIGAARTDYGVTRGADGSIATSASAASGIGYGTDWGFLLNANVSATGTATTTVDNAVATARGAQAYLHVTAVAAGTVTVTVEDSADNASFDPVTGLAFTATSAGTAQFLATASGAAIRRYLRYNVTGGTATFALNVSRN
jgi:hypothetical protein